MSYEDVLIRESVGDGTVDPDDVCHVCEKRDCVCPSDDAANLNQSDSSTALGLQEPVVPNESTETDGVPKRATNLEYQEYKRGWMDRMDYERNSFIPFLREQVKRELDDASHLIQSASTTAQPLTLDQVESFSAWIDQQGDALAAPTSFDEWLRTNNDSI